MERCEGAQAAEAVGATVAGVATVAAAEASSTAVAAGVARVGIATRLATAANPMLLALSALVTAAAAAWVGYTMWACKANDTVTEADAPKKELLKNLLQEEQRLKNVNEARRQGITLQELEARLKGNPELDAAEAAVRSARRRVDYPQPIKERLGAPESSRNIERAALEEAERQQAQQELRKAEAKVRSLKGEGSELDKQIADAKKGVKAQGRIDSDAIRKELDDAQKAAGKGFRGSSAGPAEPDTSGASKALRIAQDATNDILKGYKDAGREAAREAAQAVKQVDFEYAMGVTSFKDAEEAKERIRKDALVKSNALLQKEIVAAQQGAAKVQEAADAANKAKPGSVKPEQVDHGVAGFTSKIEEARQALKKLKDDGQEATNTAMLRRSKPLLDAIKSSEDLRRNEDLGRVALQAEVDHRTSLLGLSESQAAVEDAKYKTSQKFLQEELKLRSEIAKLANGDSPVALQRAQAELKKLEAAKPGAVESAGAVVKTEQDKAAEYRADYKNGVSKALDDYQAKVDDVAGATRSMMVRSFGGMEDALVNWARTGKKEFSSFRDSVISDLIAIAVRAQITSPLSKMLGGFFGAPVAANANGNAFDQHGIAAFASGDVFSSPTLFGFGSGRTGVMGEAGPEAVMPLTRGADGKLGVTAQGAGGEGAITIHQPIVINAPGASGDTVAQIQAMMPGMLAANKRVIEGVILQAMNRRGGRFA